LKYEVEILKMDMDQFLSVRFMSSTTFFINAGRNDPELRDVAISVFDSLGLSEWEERFSSNYPPHGHYFIGYAENAGVTVCDSDSADMPEYPYHITVEVPHWRGGTGIVITDPPKIAELLASCGFTVFIPHGAWYRTDWDGSGKVFSA
jgi:hypothetical protein